MSDIDERLEEEILHAFRKSFDSQQAGINANFLMDIQREIERLRADLAARLAPVEDESRHLTTEEQKVFHSALRRSAKIKKPVEDEALVEIAARAICLNRAAHACNCKENGVCKAPVESLREHTEIWPQARAAIAAIRPHIEAAEREKWQKMLARMGAGTTKTGAVNE